MDSLNFPKSAFADILESNLGYTSSFESKALTGTAKKGLAIVTCIDSRINPLAVVGMQAGDAKIIRNAGSRVTEDVLRTLLLATYLLGVERILVMPHTDCRMAKSDEQAIHDEIFATHAVDTRSVEFRVVSDQLAALKLDVQRTRSYPLLPKTIVVGGAIYDVHTGKLNPVEA
jgi:carbonic anhydrase